MYECNPMAMIIEAAGGRAIDGKKRIIEIVPTSLHQRIPIFIGSSDDVTTVEEFIRQAEYE